MCVGGVERCMGSVDSRRALRDHDTMELSAWHGSQFLVLYEAPCT